eukprot:COSAG02_NODE_48016_length_337_cov_0.529412_2_plen_75_part_01
MQAALVSRTLSPAGIDASSSTQDLNASDKERVQYQKSHSYEASLTTGPYLVGQRTRSDPRTVAVIVGAGHLRARF